MATPLLLFSRQHTRSTFSSATNQAGLRLNGAVPATLNSGYMSLTPSGTPSAAVNHRVDIVAGGDLGTATFKLSTDGGSNYKGHATGWSDAEGGAAGTYKTIFATTGGLTLWPSKPVLIDTDGDGVMNRAVIGFHDGSANVDMYYTDTLSRDGSTTMSAWTLLAGNAGSNYGTRPALINREGILYLFTSSLTYDITVNKSVDNGATWSALSATSITGDTGGFDACVLASGKFCVVYSDYSAPNYRIFCRTSQDGVTWSAAKQIDSSTTSQGTPCIVQLQNGTSICYWQRNSTGIKAAYNTAADPATGTWSTHTIWTTATTETRPTACVGNDGAVYVAMYDTTAEKIRYSKGNATATSYSAVADVSGGTSANTSDRPQIANIGGCIWCAFQRIDDDDVVVTFTRDWTTYSSNAAVTGTGAFLSPGGVWYTFGGSDAVASDYWDIDSVYDYGAPNMYQLTPWRPTRSTADEGDWNAVFYAGANTVFPLNYLCIWANVQTAKYQLATTDSWGSPTSHTLDFTEVGPTALSSVSSSGWLYLSSASWAVNEHRGKVLKFDTSGNVYAITRNTATNLYTTSDLSAETGNFRILNPKVCLSVSASAFAYHRVLIESQKAVENYYEVKALAAGRSFSPSKASVLKSYGQAHDEFQTAGGRIIRNPRGERRAQFVLTIYRMTSAEFKQLRGSLDENDWGAVPFAFIPDTANLNDWYPVYVTGVIEFNSERTILRLVEAV